MIAPVIWITGLPGCGKTSLSHVVCERLRKHVSAVVRLDGDLIREVTGNDLGYSRPERLENAYRVARMCRLLAEQQITVVCATVSLFHEIHAWNRKHLPEYLEVLLRTSAETLHRRDQKGLYSRGVAGHELHVPGVNQDYELPATPDLALDNDDGASLEELAESILARLHS